MKAYLIFSADAENPSDLSEPLLTDMRIADSFIQKLTGLVFRKKILENEGLLFEDCSSIHTLWMRFSLDAVFLDRDNRVLRIFPGLKPFRFTPAVRESIKVLEIKAGISSKLGIKEGCYLKFVD